MAKKNPEKETQGPVADQAVALPTASGPTNELDGWRQDALKHRSLFKEVQRERDGLNRKLERQESQMTQLESRFLRSQVEAAVVAAGVAPSMAKRLALNDHGLEFGEGYSVDADGLAAYAQAVAADVGVKAEAEAPAKEAEGESQPPVAPHTTEELNALLLKQLNPKLVIGGYPQAPEKPVPKGFDDVAKLVADDLRKRS